MQAAVYPESHPYHHSTIGSMEDLSAASLDDVGEFFRSYYAPNNAVLTIAGDFEPGAALALVERHFGPIPANPAIPPRPEMTIEARLAAEYREIIPDRVPLPRVYAAWRVEPFGTEAFDAVEVTADVLGAGRASRLYGTLVRGRRLAQDVTVFGFPIVGGASMLALWATARPGVAIDELEGALFGEIDQLATTGPSDQDLERVRNLHRAGVETSLERLAERADRLSMYTCLFDEPERLNDEIGHYERVDARRVRDSAAILRPDARVVLTYLPAEAPTEVAEAEPAEAHP
jgi:predicted Zn-dependent peptidase